jgi:hypothetical protein
MTLSGGYAAWVDWLDAYARGDDRPTDRLVAVDESMGPDMFGRLLGRISAAFTARTALWSTTLDRRMASATASGRGLQELGAVLVGARAALRPLRAFADWPLLPEALRQEMRRALSEMLQSAQRSLEDSARRLPARGDQVLAVIREHRLTTPVAAPPAARPPTGRTVIL